MNDFPECEKYTGRLRQICRGEGVSVEMCNDYRFALGLCPLPGTQFVLPPASAVPPTVLHAPGSMPPMPTFAEKVLRFAAALAGHALDGFAKCDEATIHSRLSICQTCSSFTGTHCRECGCACTGEMVFLNKLAWRSEKCPLGHW